MKAKENFLEAAIAIIILIVLFGFIMFVRQGVLGGSSPHLVEVKSSDGLVCKVTEVEGCQYFQFYNHGTYILTHKGNCTNQIHRYSLPEQP